MKKPILSSSTSIKLVVLVAGMAVFIAPAQASSVLTFSPFSFTSSVNTALSATNSFQSGIPNSVSNTTTTPADTYSQAVITPAILGVAGETGVYKTVTNWSTTKTDTSYTDGGIYTVLGSAANTSISQWIKISGSVTASAATTLTFGLTALGAYDSSFQFDFGDGLEAVPPALSLKNGTSILSSTFTSDGVNGTYSLMDTNMSKSLVAGETYTFAAKVLSTNNVPLSITNFALSLVDSAYDTSSSTSLPFISGTPVTTLVSTFPTPALTAVPLPAGVWLFMTGLMGLAYTGKKKAQRS